MNEQERDVLREIFFRYAEKAGKEVLNKDGDIYESQKNLVAVADQFIDEFITSIPEKRQLNP